MDNCTEKHILSLSTFLVIISTFRTRCIADKEYWEKTWADVWSLYYSWHRFTSKRHKKRISEWLYEDNPNSNVMKCG